MTTTRPGIGIAGMFAIHMGQQDWATIDAYLNAKPTIGRYEVSIIREICKHQRTYGIPISIDDELELVKKYLSEDRPTSFVAAWQSLRLGH